MCCFFFFNDPATTEIYTLSLHDALPIFDVADADLLHLRGEHLVLDGLQQALLLHVALEDRKSTRLNSSHVEISYAVFCLKKKNKTNQLQFSRITQNDHPPIRTSRSADKS